MLGKGLKNEAALVHPGVGQFQLCVGQSGEWLRQNQVNVDAATRVAGTSGGADPAQMSLHVKAFQKQGLEFTSPFDLNHLIDKIGPLKAPGGGAPKTSGSGDGRAPRKRRARLPENRGGVFAVASEQEQDL